MDNEVKRIVSQLKKHEIGISDIPQSLRMNLDVIKAERKAKLRKIIHCGYDVINNCFFVVEKVKSEDQWGLNIGKRFEEFEEYFDYLDGHIYDNACYYQCDPKKFPESVDLKRIFKTQAFTSEKAKIIDPSFEYSVEKKYEKSVSKYYFVVNETVRKDGIIKAQYTHRFRYMCDFVAYLSGDLSNADLTMCDGLSNLLTIEGIDFSGALISSKVCEKLHIPYENSRKDDTNDDSFEITEKNEEETAIVLQSRNELVGQKNLLTNAELEGCFTSKRIYYISDIHLQHLFGNKKAVTKADEIIVIKKLVHTFFKECGLDSIVLINGDTSYRFEAFQMFVEELGRCAKKARVTVIFTIGNHDIWSCPEDTIDQLTEKYRSILLENGMYLLQNEVLFLEDDDSDSLFKRVSLKRITEQELHQSELKDLRERVKNARLIFFGGTGFAGNNPYFNAEIGIYRFNCTIGGDRSIELAESKRFEALYKKVCSAFFDKNVIVMTHMPLSDWYENSWKQREKYSDDILQREREYYADHPEKNIGDFSCYQKGFVYVSGHTHWNYFHDDGAVRIYADNQFGYNKKRPSAWPHLKFFEVDMTYDYFSENEDGIYKISVDDYRSFYRGKSIPMTFNRKVNVIYMLKKNGYYCFFHYSKKGELFIMNGGAMKRLPHDDISYYYDKMDYVIALVDGPLKKFQSFLQNIASEVKQIGGYGTVHGCIVDIDFYNHLYLNPNDGKITCYWGENVITKQIYPTFSSLLEKQRPDLFVKYKEIREKDHSRSLPILVGLDENESDQPSVFYKETDIYYVSNQLLKSERLSSGILTIWPTDLPEGAVDKY